MKQVHLKELKRHRQDEASILHFTLPGLLPADYILALNLEIHTLSLLSEGPRLVMDQRFSVNEMRVILPILESFPHYSTYEELLAHLESDVVTATSMARSSQRLQEAQNLGTWKQELRPLRRTLSSLRQKLRTLNLEISNIRERGCSLTSLIDYRD